MRRLSAHKVQFSCGVDLVLVKSADCRELIMVVVSYEIVSGIRSMWFLKLKQHSEHLMVMMFLDHTGYMVMFRQSRWCGWGSSFSLLAGSLFISLCGLVSSQYSSGFLHMWQYIAYIYCAFVYNFGQIGNLA